MQVIFFPHKHWQFYLAQIFLIYLFLAARIQASLAKEAVLSLAHMHCSLFYHWAGLTASKATDSKEELDVSRATLFINNFMCFTTHVEGEGRNYKDLHYLGAILVLHDSDCLWQGFAAAQRRWLWFCSYAKTQIDQEKAGRYSGNLLVYSFFSEATSHWHCCFPVKEIITSFSRVKTPFSCCY